jgi:hypothetical protein
VDPRAIESLKGLGQFKKSNDLIGNLNRDLPACSIVPQPTALLRPPASPVGNDLTIYIAVMQEV